MLEGGVPTGIGCHGQVLRTRAVARPISGRFRALRQTPPGCPMSPFGLGTNCCAAPNKLRLFGVPTGIRTPVPTPCWFMLVFIRCLRVIEFTWKVPVATLSYVLNAFGWHQCLPPKGLAVLVGQILVPSKTALLREKHQPPS
jgi:hypothetical protein